MLDNKENESQLSKVKIKHLLTQTVGYIKERQGMGFAFLDIDY